MTEPIDASYLDVLPGWLDWAESEWTDVDEQRGRFGPACPKVLAHCAHGGHMAACVLLATGPEALRRQCGLSRDAMIAKALKGYRYIMSCHVSCSPDNAEETQWGHHWGSPILVERIANFVDLLRPFMSEAEERGWCEMLVSEAGHHLDTPVETNRFSRQGETHAERNYWRGSILFRAAREAADHPNAALWLDKACSYWVNSFSVPEDAECATVLDGKPCKEWFLGANVHPGFVFEHHGAVSLDYCIHTAAFHVMVALSVLRNNWTPMQAMFHRVNDCWNFTRRCILPNGRVAFVGGVQRPRYMLSQAYLVPILAYQARFGGDPHAEELLRQVCAILMRDREASGDGSFYSDRGAGLKEMMTGVRALYYYRLEADVIYSLGLAHLIAQLPDPDAPTGPTAGTTDRAPEALEAPIHSRDVGLVLQRTSHGLFSVYWGRSHTAEADPPLSLCIPFANPHRVDWLSNLATVFKPFRPERHVVGWGSLGFPNGFATAGTVQEARLLSSDDGAGYAVEQRLAFILLPDGRTLLRFEKAAALKEVATCEIASLNLNLANDMFTGNEFVLAAADGARRVQGIGGEEKTELVRSRWVNVADELGIIALRGPDAFTLETFADRQRQYKTLLVERLYYPLIQERRTFAPGETVLETAVMLVAGASAEETEGRARNLDATFAGGEAPGVELLCFRADADRHAVVAINFSDVAREVAVPALSRFADVEAVTPGVSSEPGAPASLPAWGAGVWLCG